MGVDERVGGRAAEEARDDALAAEDDAHGVGRQVARDGGAVPKLEPEGKVEGAMRIGQQIAKRLQPVFLAAAHAAPVVPARSLMAGGGGDNRGRGERVGQFDHPVIPGRAEGAGPE